MSLEIWPALKADWASAGVIFMAVGILAGCLRSSLRFPRGLHVAAIILLLGFGGFHGGLALAEVGLTSIWKQTLAIGGFGFLMPVWMWPVLRYLGRQNAAGAGLGSVQFGWGHAGVFAAAVAYLKINHEFADDLSYGFLLLIPVGALASAALLTGCMPPRLAGQAWWETPKLAAFSLVRVAGFVPLAAGMVAGYFSSHNSAESLLERMPHLVPALGLVLMLELGLAVGAQWRRMPKISWVLIAFAVLAPVANAAAALYLARRAHLSPGMGTLLAIMAATGPALLPASLARRVFKGGDRELFTALETGIALPLNVLIGLPVYWQLAHRYVNGG